MIYDKFANAHLYAAPETALGKALKFAADFDPETPDGRIEIDGDKMYAILNTYDTNPSEDLSFEAHRRHIDVQVLLSGAEDIDVSQDLDDMEVIQQYSEDSDAGLYDTQKNWSTVVLTPGTFVVFYPDDAHRPGIGDGSSVRKLVVKILM
ncbi:MAG: YhcH/YjgK/YiaL family protein [Phycisphaerae bacterium]|nr:YhcH/YjgK/YiaL family protein [Phycisphaerae bacterium]